MTNSFCIILLLSLATTAPGCTAAELSQVVGPTPAIKYSENPQTGEIIVISEDGTRYVIDCARRVQSIVEPSGQVMTRKY